MTTQTPTDEAQPNANDRFSRVVRDAAVIVLAASAVGLVANALRPGERLPWVQLQPYDIVVPCPEPVGDATALGADDPRLLLESSMLIDTRAASEFARGHLPRAINVPFDWLGPPVEKDVREVTQRVARSHARQVIVYGDGDDPDSGREWARLLAGGGIKNVSYVTGGATALRSQFSPPDPDGAERGEATGGHP